MCITCGIHFAKFKHKLSVPFGFMNETYGTGRENCCSVCGLHKPSNMQILKPKHRLCLCCSMCGLLISVVDNVSLICAHGSHAWPDDHNTTGEDGPGRVSRETFSLLMVAMQSPLHLSNATRVS